MRILYLDTSSSFLYSALIDNNVLLDEIKEELNQNLSTQALFKIEEMFHKNNILPNSIEKIIVVNGPGSFTGVRIGITIAKTYAWCLNIPVIAISSLEAMAVSSKSKVDFKVPIIDARRNYVYSSIFDSNYNSILKGQYIKLDALKVAVKSLGDNFVFVSSDDFEFPHEKYDPDILKIVKIFSSRECVNPHLLDANYLKLTEAEEKQSDN